MRFQIENVPLCTPKNTNNEVSLNALSEMLFYCHLKSNKKYIVYTLVRLYWHRDTKCVAAISFLISEKSSNRFFRLSYIYIPCLMVGATGCLYAVYGRYLLNHI